MCVCVRSAWHLRGQNPRNGGFRGVPCTQGFALCRAAFARVRGSPLFELRCFAKSFLLQRERADPVEPNMRTDGELPLRMCGVPPESQLRPRWRLQLAEDMVACSICNNTRQGGVGINPLRESLLLTRYRFTRALSCGD